MGRTSALIAGALTLLAACSVEAPRSAILITIDTCRADHVVGGPEAAVATPELDRFAVQGRRYSRAFSASASTAPSHASILTGRYPSWHSVGLYNGKDLLLESSVTLPEVLLQRGFRTGAVISNPALRSRGGWDQGFEHYDDELEDREKVRGYPERRAERAVDLALEWLGEHRGEAFFFWLHLQDPHGPYDAPIECEQETSSQDGDLLLPEGEDHSGFGAIPRYQLYGEERSARVYRERYACEVNYADQQLGRLFERLRSDAALQNTLTLLTADHGEALGEDGYYFGHSHSVALDQVHVPLILVGPGILPGEHVEEPITNVSAFATVLDFLDVAAPEELHAPSLLGDTNPDAVFVETLNQVGIARGEAFLRRDRHPADDQEYWSAGNPVTEGFWKPLGEEARSLLGPDHPLPPDSLGRARQLLDEHDMRAVRARESFSSIREEVPPSPADEEALRSLGYVE